MSGKYYVDKTIPELGFYSIDSDDGERFRWRWEETAQGKLYVEFGSWFNHPRYALEDAADDWESHGSSPNRRLSGMMRSVAKRLAVKA